MTYIVSSGALNSTHSLTQCWMLVVDVVLGDLPLNLDRFEYLGLEKVARK